MSTKQEMIDALIQLRDETANNWIDREDRYVIIEEETAFKAGFDFGYAIMLKQMDADIKLKDDLVHELNQGLKDCFAENEKLKFDMNLIVTQGVKAQREYNQQLSAKNEIMREALEFYSNRLSWDDSNVIYKHDCIDEEDMRIDEHDKNKYGGKTAREALEKCK